MKQEETRDTEPIASGAFDIQRIRCVEDIDRLRFYDGIAAVEAPMAVVRKIRFKNHHRGESPRLEDVRGSIRDKGYRPFEPIIIRIGQKGRWVVVDGGHRLTAAFDIDDEFWANLLHRKVGNLYFLLFTTARSWRKLKTKLSADIADDPSLDEIAEDDDRDDPGDANRARPTEAGAAAAALR